MNTKSSLVGNTSLMNLIKFFKPARYTLFITLLLFVVSCFFSLWHNSTSQGFCDPCGCKEYVGLPLWFFQPEFCPEFTRFHEPSKLNAASLVIDFCVYYFASCFFVKLHPFLKRKTKSDRNP